MAIQNGSEIVCIGLSKSAVHWIRSQRQTTQTVTFDAAVEANLDDVVNTLNDIGFRGERPGPRRSWRLDPETWLALQLAAQETGISAANLLRACIALASTT